MSRSSLGRGLAAIIPDNLFDDEAFGANADGASSALRLVDIERLLRCLRRELLGDRARDPSDR